VSESSAWYREAYAAAFDAYVASPGEEVLRAAYELGREAVAGELSVLELANVHHEVLRSHVVRARSIGEAERIADAAAEFFLESLSAYEMVQRGLRAARDAALVEQRQTALLRQLSNFLADASLAVDADDSLDELLQLIAEQTRELIGAACCVATASLGDGESSAVAICHVPDDEGWREWVATGALAAAYAGVRTGRGVVRMTRDAIVGHPAAAAVAASGRPLRAWLAAPLTRLDGRDFGLIHLFDKEQGEFTEIDGEILLQLAQMSSAAIERIRLYPRAGHAR
jgi:GAF domain-containing protein